jgi:hypothetical protein
MKEIQLTKGKVALVDDDMFDYLNQWKWRIHTGYAKRDEYIKGSYPSKKHKTFYMHREVLDITGKLEKNMFVDHIDRGKLNNQKDNLRLATTSQNAINAFNIGRNKSGYKGVRFDKNSCKWRAVIKHQGKDYWLGQFEDIKDAVVAYNEGAKKYFGEFAYINKI